MLALPLLIQGKSRMRKRACTDLCGGRSAMVVPTATEIGSRQTLHAGYAAGRAGSNLNRKTKIRMVEGPIWRSYCSVA
jgi:hypothetical protein